MKNTEPAKNEEKEKIDTGLPSSKKIEETPPIDDRLTCHWEMITGGTVVEI